MHSSPAICSTWKINGVREFHWHRWDDQYVVYDYYSGDTHLLDPLAADVLRYFDEAPTPLSYEDIFHSLSPALRDGPEAMLSERVQETIASFQRLDLIDIVP